MGEERFLLQLNGVFMLDTNPFGIEWKKPFKYTKEQLMEVLDSIVFDKGDTIVIFTCMDSGKNK